jgi:hypothetical protein
MFSSSAFPAQALVNQESAEAMASAAKRARTEAPESYRKLDLEALILKKIEGRDSTMYLAVIDNHMAEFILTPEEPAVLLRGFDMLGEKEKRSFNVDDGKGNSLGLYVQLDEEQADFLKKASNRIKTEFEADEAVEWTPMIPGEKYSTYAVGVEVVLAGQESSLTHLRIKKGEEKHAGTGWAFLKEMAGERTFKGSEAMFVVKFRAWKAVVNGVTKAGLKLVATQLVIKVTERKFVDVLPDW